MGFLDSLFGSKSSDKSSIQSIVGELEKLNAINSSDDISNIIDVLNKNNLPLQTFLNIAKSEIQKGEKLVKIIKGNSHEGSRNLMYFINQEEIQDLVLKISELSIVNTLLGQSQIIPIIDDKVREVGSPMFAMAYDSIVADLFRVIVAVSGEKNFCKKKNIDYKFTIGKDWF